MIKHMTRYNYDICDMANIYHIAIRCDIIKSHGNYIIEIVICSEYININKIIMIYIIWLML